MRDNEQVARESGLPEGGALSGVITLIQESRFRLVDEQGRGYLFTLGWDSGTSINDLSDWSRQAIRVTVEFEGAPDLGAVATGIQAVPATSVGPSRRQA